MDPTYHNVVSKIAEWELKNWNGLHVDAGQKPIGWPQVSGRGALAVMSLGIEFLGKKKTEIPSLSQSIAYTPPPLVLKPGPYELVRGSLIPQPALPVSAAAQFGVLITAPDTFRDALLVDGMLHPGFV